MSTLYKSINPATEEKLASFTEHGDKFISICLKNAHESQSEWRTLAAAARVKYLPALTEIIKAEKSELAKLISLEMGKPYPEAVAEINKCILLCDYYNENLKLFLKEETILTDATKSYVSFEPLGTVLAIMPWNFPFWQVFRNAIPALMAGNSVILKHAPNVPQCAIAIEELFLKAGFPEHLFQHIFLSNENVEKLIAAKEVRMISLTGSSKAGSSVAALAGKYIKKSLLELGGSDPFIVLDSANLSSAVETAVKSRLMNAGQSCIAAKRFIVSKKVAGNFTEMLLEEVKKIKIGDPFEEGVRMGPLARNDLRENFVRQIDESVKKGAKPVYGGQAFGEKGFFVKPAILSGMKPGMPVFDEEVFGPAISICTFKEEHEAIELANQTEYGLGASIWSEEPEKVQRYVKQINAGNVFVNALVKSDVRLPFGGIKNSGYGRELSAYGLKEFCNVKSIWIH